MGEKKTQRGGTGVLQNEIFIRQSVLILFIAILLAAAGCAFMISRELKTDDQILKNTAEAVAHTQMLGGENDAEHRIWFLDSLKKSLENIDVISVIDREGLREYHSNHNLIGTVYDGEIPDFSGKGTDCYTEYSTGPSGTQRRAYAAVYDGNGELNGFVIAVLLRENIANQIVNEVLVFFSITIIAIMLEMLVAHFLSQKIKLKLMGYEPDSFSAMFRIREDILESLKEGIIAVDREGEVRFTNSAAKLALGAYPAERFSQEVLSDTLQSGRREMSIQERLLAGTPVIIDRIPIMENESVSGAVAILHNRKEYTSLMEELAGTRYLVDSMRANNHDFTNKLHVILGLIRIGRTEEAANYIENITLTRQETIRQITQIVDEPTIAALLIGKAMKAAELNINFLLHEGSGYHYEDIPLPKESLNTILGNLIDNAYDAMNVENNGQARELLLGLRSEPGVLLISVDDTGAGMPAEVRERIFEKGFSTKGEGRGTGLYQTALLVQGLGGEIQVDSFEGVGTSFTVTFRTKGMQ